MSIKILVVQDNPESIKLITAYLNGEQDLLVIGTATTYSSSVQAVRVLKPDVVLMHVPLKGENWEHSVRTIAAITVRKTVKMFVFSSLKEEQVIQHCFQAGAVHYVYKENFKDLPQMIRSCFRNNSPMEALLKDYLRLKKEEKLRTLTAAERAIFDLVKEGLTLADISRKLMKSERTLKNQVNSMLKKLHAKSCKEAIGQIERVEQPVELPQAIH